MWSVRRNAAHIMRDMKMVLCFLSGCIVASMVFTMRTQSLCRHVDDSLDIKAKEAAAAAAASNAILNDPSLFAEYLRDHYMCHLPSDSACGHDQDYFRIFERKGVHVLPVHFYSIVPDLQSLTVSNFMRPKVDATSLRSCDQDPLSSSCPIPALKGLDFNLRRQLEVVSACETFQNEFSAIPSIPPVIDGVEHFHSRWVCSQHTPEGRSCPPFGAIDAQVYHCMIRQFKPKKVLEIGSGFSTYIATAALSENKKAGGDDPKLIAVEPFPSEGLRALSSKGQLELITAKIQDVDIKVFEALEAGDILFIDSTHIAAPGSDVVHLFTRVLPVLRAGVVVHVHDICLPFETAWDWSFESYRFWNEQYLLHSFLLSNTEWEILYMGALWEHYLGKKLGKAFPLGGGNGSFWMRKKMS